LIIDSVIFVKAISDRSHDPEIVVKSKERKDWESKSRMILFDESSLVMIIKWPQIM